jgi:hypothetical protein
MPTISNTPRPGYVYDSTDDVWYPIGTGSHNHSEIASTIVDAKGDIIAATAADAVTRLAVGVNNTRLVAASAEATGLKYVADTQNTVIDAEGDLLVGDAADTVQRLALGSNAQVLTVDTTVDGKIKWATPASGAMTRISTTPFSSVSAISIDGCFTSTYANYVAYLTFTGDSSQTNINVVMRVGGVSDTNGYSTQAIFANGSTPDAGEDLGGGGVMRIGQHLEYTNGTKIEFYAPEIAKSTSLLSYSNSYLSSGGNTIYLVGGVHVDSTQFDGFRLQFDNSQSGTVRVYGLEN